LVAFPFSSLKIDTVPAVGGEGGLKMSLLRLSKIAGIGLEMLEQLG